MYVEIPLEGLEYSRKSFRTEVIDHLVEERISQNCAINTLHYYDIYFTKTKFKITPFTIKILFACGMLESEEYLNSIVRFSPEIIICISAINQMSELSASYFEIFKNLLDMLASDSIWEKRKHLKYELYKKKEMKYFLRRIFLMKTLKSLQRFNAYTIAYFSQHLGQQKQGQ